MIKVYYCFKPFEDTSQVCYHTVDLLIFFYTHRKDRNLLFMTETYHIPFCLLYTSDATDEEDSVDLGGRRIIKKKKKIDTDSKTSMEIMKMKYERPCSK